MHLQLKLTRTLTFLTLLIQTNIATSLHKTMQIEIMFFIDILAKI